MLGKARGLETEALWLLVSMDGLDGGAAWGLRRLGSGQETGWASGCWEPRLAL